MFVRKHRPLGEDTSWGGGREKIERQTSSIFLLRLFWPLVYDNRSRRRDHLRFREIRLQLAIASPHVPLSRPISPTTAAVPGQPKDRRRLLEIYAPARATSPNNVNSSSNETRVSCHTTTYEIDRRRRIISRRLRSTVCLFPDSAAESAPLEEKQP